MSDNELDAELLAMAGDGSDDDGDDVGDDAGSVADSPVPTQEGGQPTTETAEDLPQNRKGVAQKVKAKGRKKRRQESEEQEDLGGNASSSPPESLASAAMVQSDSDADAPASPDAPDGVLYPIDGQYLSASDREHILSLPEIEREEILAERAHEVTKRQQDLQLKKALAAAQAAGNRHKRKAVAAELEDGGRRVTRPKAEKGRSALDDYKRARELKGTERIRLDALGERKDEHSPSLASDQDADGESEVEWAEPHADSRREEPAAEIKGFERCRVGRSNFAKVCFYPDFENAVKGCFCRVSIGVNRETGQNQYRMAQIKGFTEGKPYQLEGINGKQFTTDQYAIVAQGSAEKPWPFSACSDGKFTDAEFDRFAATLRKENLRLPGRKVLENKLDDIHALLNMEWTDAQISAKIARQRAMERKHDPAHAARIKREDIQKRRLEAEESGDAEAVMKCDADLATLENVSNGALRIKPSPAKGGALMQQDRLAQLNAKNRGKNAEAVRKALIEEKRRMQAAREATLAENRAKEAAKREKDSQQSMLAIPRSDMVDLFGDASDISRTGTPANGGTPKRSRAGTPMNGLKTEKSGLGHRSGPLGALKAKKSMDDDVMEGLDLGIDVDI